MVQCTCGTVKQVKRNDLMTGKTLSCGCLDLELKKSRKTHGQCAANCPGREYWAYRYMLTRCYNPNTKQFSDYGGRGIGVFSDWRGRGGFERWFAHIGPRPSRRHSQDRKDNNKDYEPGNVHWATRETQNNNTRGNRYITYGDQTKTLAQWSKHTGISRAALTHRLNRNWSIEDALTVPMRSPHKTKKQETA